MAAHQHNGHHTNGDGHHPSDHDDHGHGGHDHPPGKPFARVRQLLAPEGREIAWVVLFALVVAVLSLATPITVESLVNTVSFGVLLWPVIAIAGVLMACLGLAAAVKGMQVYVIEMLQRRLFVRVVADFARRMPRVRLDALDGRNGPELANRFFDVMNVQKSLATLLLDGIALVVTAAVGMAVLAFYHPFLLGFDILMMVGIAIILFGFGWGGISSSLRESHAKYDVAGWLEELMRSLRPFKFAGGRHLALDRADHLAQEYVTARRSHFRVVWRQTVFALALQVVASTALLGLGGYLVINRQLTLGQLVAAELIVALVVASVAKLGKYAETFYDLLAGAEKLGLITDLELERAGGEPPADTGRGMAVRVRGVVPARRHLYVPSDCHAHANEKVAVVGPPGSGKTTLFEMLCGLREPARGVVELDGIDLRGMDLDQLRDQVALVERADVFPGTVSENIRVGRPHLSPHEVREALRVVGLTGAVHELPNGLDTSLAVDGQPLSATQAVRLTIARAVAGRPRLLILDGVLDQLDLRECPDLLGRLLAADAPWTLLVATADKDIIDRCDRVIELARPSRLAAADGGTAHG